MSADNSNNSTPPSGQSGQNRTAGTAGRGDRAAQQILRDSAVPNSRTKADAGSKQSGRAFNPGRETDKRGKGFDVDKAASLLGYDVPDKKEPKSSPADRSRPGDDRGKGGREADPDRNAPGRERENAIRPALDLDDDEQDPAVKAARKSKAKTLSDFADEMGLNAKDLYEIAIPFDDDDEPMTIGALKDRVKEVRTFERDRDDFEDYRADSMNEVLTARQQIDGVMQRIMQFIPQDQLASAFGDYQQQHQQRVGEARKQLKEYFPEWSDASRMASDREELDSHLSSYGFSKFEVDALQDARLIRYAVHAMRLMKRYQRMKDEIKGYRDKIPTTAPTSRRPGRSDPSTAAKSQAQAGDKIGAITTLMGKR